MKRGRPKRSVLKEARITIRLDGDQMVRLKEISRVTGICEGTLTRESLAALICHFDTKSQTLEFPLEFKADVKGKKPETPKAEALAGVRIEKGILPPWGIRSGYRAVVMQMEAGDSIVVPDKDREHWRREASRIGARLCARRLDEKPGYYRLWRMADDAKRRGGAK